MKGRPRVLLADDDDSLRRVVEFQLQEDGFDVTAVAGGIEAVQRLREAPYDLLVTDLLMPGLDGFGVLERARRERPGCAAVVITAHGDVATAVRAMQAGAVDFLEKPFSRDRLRVTVRKALELAELRDENRKLRELVEEEARFGNLLGTSAALKTVISQLGRAAASDATVLLLGESGTGKELAARALHLNSARRDGPFVVANCGALPESLIEAELFGHRKGAFTGADRDRQGKFERAHGGTLFLDEIGEIPLALQPRLLRAVQEGEVDTIGAGTAVRVDVRIVAATNRDLEARVRAGEFREDLWYRLNVVPLVMPPLRERRGDVPLLAAHFLARSAGRHGRPVPALAPDALAALERHDWPGNVRELENLMERLVVLGGAGPIEAADLPESVRREAPRYGGARIEVPETGIVLVEVERGRLEEALRRCGGNQSAAARFLGISRQTLLYRMQKFNLKG